MTTDDIKRVIEKATGVPCRVVGCGRSYTVHTGAEAISKRDFKLINAAMEIEGAAASPDGKLILYVTAREFN